MRPVSSTTFSYTHLDVYKRQEQGIVIGSGQAREIVDRNTVVVVVDTNRPSYTECEDILRMTPTVVVLDVYKRQGFLLLTIPYQNPIVN